MSEQKGRADEIDKLVSYKLKMRRMMLGLSQQEIGKAVDVSIQQIQKYEKATNRIASGKLYTLAKFLKVPINYFFENQGDNNVIGSVFAEEHEEYDAADDTIVSEKEVVSLIKSFSEVKNSQTRKKIIELIKSMS
ncbi:MAG TPA: helix-turn-helix transcriptional regulator [Candidatus Megaira endosymbiont of Nemacystus decipiens]|nr:helix-turn-helix transcriptional regulator [Candidatus Megaera endosymbiont of Nemacystus decipiens]